MYWNHRIVRRRWTNPENLGGNTVVVYGIHEAFYDDNNKVSGITVEPIDLSAECLNDLKSTWDMVLDAFRAPILDFDKIPEEGYDESKDGLARSLNLSDEELAEESRPFDEVMEEIMPGWTPKDEAEYLKEEEERRETEESEHVEKYVGHSPDEIRQLIKTLRSKAE